MSIASQTPLAKEERVRIRPTPYGWFLLFLLVWVPLAALVTSNNFLYIVFVMMLALVVISNRLGRRNIESITLSRRFPEELFAQTPFPIDYVLKSNNQRWGSFAATFTEQAPLVPSGPPPTFSHISLQDSLSVAGYASIASRGDRRILPGILSSTYPFGLARYTKVAGPSEPVLVFPQILPVEDEIPAWIGGMGKGTERADPFGTIPYLFRDYVAGDRFKHIDWKKSARTGSLVTKVLSDEGAREITIRLPANPSERALSRAASLVLHFGITGRPMRLEGPSIKAVRGSGHDFTRRILALLARWDSRTQGETLPERSNGIAVDIDGAGGFFWQPLEDTYDDKRQHSG